MKNNKGFTLTELLVVVAILGIISGMAMTLIRNLSATFEKNKYENYSDSVLAAARIYKDSYGEDLFGHNDYGCAYVTYQQLVERNLLKDIQIDNVSCNSDKTYIRIIKQKDKYGYTKYLGCGPVENGTVTEVTTTVPSVVPDMDVNSCTGVNPSNIIVSATPIKSEQFNKKRKSAKVTLSSYTGLDNNIVISAKWSQDANAGEDPNGWERLTFKVKGDQEKTLLDGDPVTSTSKQLTTPDGGAEVDGGWKLFVKVDYLRDMHGNRWKNPTNENLNYVVFEPYNVDTIPPVISNLNVVSTVSTHNSNQARVTFTGSDNRTTDVRELKMCVSESSSRCQNDSDFEAYSSSKNITLSTTGSATKTVYVYLKDKAGNISSDSKSYTLQGRVVVYDKYCNENGANCGGRSCDQYGNNCVTKADKTRTLVGTYNTRVSVSPQSETGFTNSSAYNVTYDNASHTLTFYHTRTLSYPNNSDGITYGGYSFSGSDDTGITISYARGGTLQIWPAGRSGAGESPFVDKGSGSRINYSDIGDNGDATHRHQKGTFFVKSDVSGASTLVVRPYIRVKYNVSGLADQIKKPHNEITIKSASQTGYTLRAWQLYSYTNSNGESECRKLDSGGNWNVKVYYAAGSKITAGKWNISNDSYPCPLLYGYKDYAGDLTINFKAVWQKNAWYDYR